MKLSDISSFINEEVIQTIVESNPSIVCLEPIVSARKYRLPSGREIDVLIETVSGNVYVVELKPSPDPNICKVILYGKELIEQNIFSKEKLRYIGAGIGKFNGFTSENSCNIGEIEYIDLLEKNNFLRILLSVQVQALRKSGVNSISFPPQKVLPLQLAKEDVQNAIVIPKIVTEKDREKVIILNIVINNSNEKKTKILKEISSKLNLSEPTISLRVKKLRDEEGLLRDIYVGKGNEKRVSVTKAGRDFLDFFIH